MNELSIGHFVLNTNKQSLLYIADNGTTTGRKLSFREASILGILIEAQGEIVENRRLLLEFWGSDTVYNLNCLYVFMSRMKQVLAADSSLSIVNVRGIGYRLIQDET